MYIYIICISHLCSEDAANIYMYLYLQRPHCMKGWCLGNNCMYCRRET